jgi:hypothetical protein
VLIRLGTLLTCVAIEWTGHCPLALQASAGKTAKAPWDYSANAAADESANESAPPETPKMSAEGRQLARVQRRELRQKMVSFALRSNRVSIEY